MNAISDAELGIIITDYIHASDHPDLVVYRQDFQTKFDLARLIANLRKVCELGNYQGKRVLEVGCGFGWDAVCLSLIGNNRIIATDILPSMIDGVAECIAHMKQTGRTLDVEPICGDICDIDLPDGTFDGVYSSEAIEHVHDLGKMIGRCWRLLKPGGRLIFINDSNRFNSAFRESTFKMWKERDESWEHADWLKREIRPVEHKDAKPYAAMREEIIRDLAPELEEESRSRLVAATAGMIAPEIGLATRNYVEGHELPERPAFSWCRNPLTGEYAERLLDPFEIAEMLQSAGFEHVRIRHGFNRFPFRLLNGIRFRPLNKLLFDRRGLFIIIADKPQ